MYAEDWARNVATKIITFCIDRTPPEPFDLIPPGNDVWVRHRDIKFSWSKSKDVGYGLKDINN